MYLEKKKIRKIVYRRGSLYIAIMTSYGLNRLVPDEQEGIPEVEVDVDVDTSDVTAEEVIKAIQWSKNHKAPVMDGSDSEMIKAEDVITPVIFSCLFKRI